MSDNSRHALQNSIRQGALSRAGSVLRTSGCLHHVRKISSSPLVAGCRRSFACERDQMASGPSDGLAGTQHGSQQENHWNWSRFLNSLDCRQVTPNDWGRHLE